MVGRGPGTGGSLFFKYPPMDQRQLNTLRMSRGEVAHFDGAPALWNEKTVLVSVVNVVKTLTNGIVQAGLTQQEMLTGGYTLDKDKQLELMGAVTEPLVRGLRPLARMTGNNALLKQVDFAPTELLAGPEQEIVNRCQLIQDAAKARVTELAGYGVTPAMISGQQVAIDTFKPLAGLRDAVGGKRQAATASLPDLFDQLRDQLALLDDLVENLVEDTDFKGAYRELRATTDTRGRGPGKDEGEDDEAPTPPVAA